MGTTAQPVHFTLLDGLGSVRHLTDGSGNVVRSISYDAWGNVRHSTGSMWTRLGYTGEPMGVADGMIYLRARMYNPALGSFLQRDSFEGMPNSPQSLHRYRYAQNNPVNWTDPTGHYVDEYGDWHPCNVLPGREDTCTFKDYSDWWGSKDGDRFRKFGWVVATDLLINGTILGLPVGLYYLVKDPAGTIIGAIMAVPNTIKDLSKGILCGDPESLGHGVAGYILFYRHGSRSWNKFVDDNVHPGSSKPPSAPDDSGPSIPCTNSFSADTLVTTASGLRPISTIAVGDLVLAWDETTRATGYYTVTAVMLHTDAAQVHLSVGGEHVETTPEHPFFTLERGWVAAGDLWDGAHVRRADGSYALTLVLWLDAEPQVMYNLTVATAHTFFVGVERALVHNARCPNISMQNLAGGAGDDFLQKGLHFNYGEGEFGLRTVLRDDGMIEITIHAVRKNRPVPTPKQLRTYLEENRDTLLTYLGKAIDHHKVPDIPGQPRLPQPDRVNEARLIARALSDKNPFVILEER